MTNDRDKKHGTTIPTKKNTLETTSKSAMGESSKGIVGVHSKEQNGPFDNPAIPKGEMEKIEALCRRFGVPDPGELYIVPRNYETYGKPNLTQFDSKLPTGLTRWVDESEFEYTIGKINSIFENAEKIGCRAICNGICKFLTCFLIRTCQKSKTERAIIRVRNFIVSQNQDVYHSKGFHIVEPAARGLRHLEFRSITYYSMKYFLDHEDEVNVTESEVLRTLPHHHDSDYHPHHLHARTSAMSHF